jgi:5-methyltetrahydropteroyltriglutamate--homocysteine methyltransferase
MSGPQLFPTQEVGSIAKPRWLVQGLKGERPSAAALEELQRWHARVPFVPEHDPRLKKLLKGEVAEIGPHGLRDLGALFGLRYLETAGLDLVYDGEARRMEMYEFPIRQMTGFKLLGHVRSFDNKYYLKGAAVGKVGLPAPYHVDEFEFLKGEAKRELKVPITGAYTLADWSWNEYYLGKQKGWKGRKVRRAAQRELVVDIARHAIRPTLKALIDKGARVLQIDEPAAGTHPDESDLVVEGFNESTEGLDAKFAMHICFSDYRCLFPALLDAKRCSQFLWEFANRDTPEKDGYRDLELFAEFNDRREVGLGVTDIHRDSLESPELIRDRILKAARILGDPSRVYVNPDCGLRTRTLEVAWEKLTRMVRGAELARAALK